MNVIENSTVVASNNTVDSANSFLQLSIWSVRIVCALFVILSPISNWACIRIFQSRIYARSSSKWYFIFIAIFDTIYVVVTAPLVFLLSLQIYILNWNVLFCKSIFFFNYLSCQISAGLLACLSIDRLVATSYLSLYRQTCTTNFSRTVCFAVIVVFSIVNSHYLIGYTIDSEGFCTKTRYKWYEENYSNLNIVYLLSYSIIPFTIITICNIFIVISVCRNKTNMRKKYEIKKRVISSNNQRGQSITSKNSLQICERPTKVLNVRPCSMENKHEMFVSINGRKLVNNILNTNSDCEPNRINLLSDKLLLTGEESVYSTATSSILLEHKLVCLPSQRERSISTSMNSSSSTNSQKMCVQLQITISLLAISICFIFCTLPNCISTIMIQTYINDDKVRQFWQAINYFSIIPLLITHSVNLLFYYLSSNMFRERFKEYYFKKKV